MLRATGWEEVGTFAAPDEKPSVRLWKNHNHRRRAGTPPKLIQYAIQVFAGTGCRRVHTHPIINRYARSAVSGGLFGSSFFEIGFMDAKQNTWKADDRAVWSLTLTVEPASDCPTKEAK